MALKRVAGVRVRREIQIGPFTLGASEYERLGDVQNVEPMRVGDLEGEVLWWWQDRFYWATDALTSEEVQAGAVDADRLAFTERSLTPISDYKASERRLLFGFAVRYELLVATDPYPTTRRFTITREQRAMLEHTELQDSPCIVAKDADSSIWLAHGQLYVTTADLLSDDVSLVLRDAVAEGPQDV